MKLKKENNESQLAPKMDELESASFVPQNNQITSDFILNISES